MDAATLALTETQVLEAEVSRLKAALTRIQRHASLLADGAHDDGQNTLASGFALLAGLAGDALEAA